MKTIWIVLIILGLIGFFLFSFVMSTYNGLVKAELNYETQWSQVENQFQRRYDFIPNLVNSVKGMMQQEQDIFKAIADARTKYGGAATVKEKVNGAMQIETALSRLLVVMENYPDLKSSQHVTGLMDELAGTENRIAVERRRFNDSVKDYNIKVKVFPSNILAGMFGFTEAALFESVDEADQAPEVIF